MVGKKRDDYRPRRAQAAQSGPTDPQSDNPDSTGVEQEAPRSRRGRAQDADPPRDSASDSGAPESASGADTSENPTGAGSTDNATKAGEDTPAENAAVDSGHAGTKADDRPDDTAVRPVAGSEPTAGSEQAAEPEQAPTATGATAPAADAGDTTAGRPAQTTSERIAEARRLERLAELRRLRDAKGQPESPEKADRPDVRRRRSRAAAEPAAPTGRRRLGLLVGAIAVVLVAAVVAAVVFVNGRPTTPVAGQTPTPSAPASPGSVISSDAMLSPEAAGSIIDQQWQIDTDQPGDVRNAPTPACLDLEVDDALRPKESLARTLTTTKGGPTALHRAEAYQTPELATEAFALMAKALGECNLKGSYIEASRVITGLGDEATGIVLDDPEKDSHRAVVLNRTGRVINVLDVAATGETPNIDKTAEALIGITDGQCTLAVGICASDASITDGPPPIGGDQPGFLALSDIPVPRNGQGTWGGLDPGSPDDVVTSGCENVEFGDLPADNRAARSYVLADNPKGMPDTFGLDQITLSMSSTKDASDLADTIADNIRDCEDRLPTATVKGVTDVEATGSGSTEIKGIAATVEQQVTTDESTTYRVGIVSAGTKVVYTFLSKEKDWDLTKDQWTTVTARAAERATQVR